MFGKVAKFDLVPGHRLINITAKKDAKSATIQGVTNSCGSIKISKTVRDTELVQKSALGNNRDFHQEKVLKSV